MLDVLKFRSSALKPDEVSPMRAEKTPLVTLWVVDAGAEDGQSRVPVVVAAVSQIENLK